MKKARQPLDAIKAVEEQMEILEEKVQQPTSAASAVPKQAPSRHAANWANGFTCAPSKPRAVITSLSESDAEVQVGALRVRAKLGDLARPSEEPEARPAERTAGRTAKDEASCREY